MTEALSLEGLERLIVQHIESVCSDGNTNPMSVAKPLAEAIRLQLSLPTGSREAIARIIDPEPWEGNLRGLNIMVPQRDAALAKADAILAPSPGGGLREALLELFEAMKAENVPLRNRTASAVIQAKRVLFPALTQAPASQGGAA